MFDLPDEIVAETKARFELGFPIKDIAIELNLMPRTVIEMAAVYDWKRPRRGVPNGRTFRRLAPCEVRMVPDFTTEEAFAIGLIEDDILKAARRLGLAAEAQSAWDKILMCVGFDG